MTRHAWESWTVTRGVFEIEGEPIAAYEIVCPYDDPVVQQQLATVSLISFMQPGEAAIIASNWKDSRKP